MLLSLVTFLALYLGLWNLEHLPLILLQLREVLEMSRVWVLLTLTLIPVSMTMNMVWKLKELVLKSIFARATPQGDLNMPGAPETASAKPPEENPNPR